MQKEMEKELVVNSLVHSNNMLSRIVKYAHNKHMYNSPK